MKKKGPKAGKFASGGTNGAGKLKFNNGLKLDSNETLCANRTILLSVTSVENVTVVADDNTTVPVALFKRGLALVETTGSVAVTFGSEGYGEPVLTQDNAASTLSYTVSFIIAILAIFAF